MMSCSAATNSTTGGQRRRIKSPNKSNSKSPNKSNSNSSNSASISNSANSGNNSPMSIIEQWKQDAKGAVEDAYSNYVLGDDTGESKRLVLVSNPFDDIIIQTTTIQTTSIPTQTTAATATAATIEAHHHHPPHILLNDQNSSISSRGNKAHYTPPPPSNNGNGALSSRNYSQLLLVNHREFYADINPHRRRRQYNNNNNPKNKYNNPHSITFASCGITYVSINGRAYVHDIDITCTAYIKSGIRPKDCVQYAAVLAKEWNIGHDNGDNDDNDNDNGENGDDFNIISNQALDREQSGQRITYEELKRVFLHGSGILNDNTDHHHQQGPIGAIGAGPIMHQQQPPAIPSSIRIIGKNPCGGGSFIPDDDDDDNNNDDDDNNNNKDNLNNNGNGVGCDPRPVVLVFRRTKQRPQKQWNVWPNYRLDDECDVACQILHSLTTSSCASTSTSYASTSTSTTPSSRRPQQQQQQRSRSRSRSRGLLLCGRGEDDVFDDLEDNDDADNDESTTLFLDANGSTATEFNTTSNTSNTTRRQQNIDFNIRRQNIRGCSKVLFSTDGNGTMEEIGNNASNNNVNAASNNNNNNNNNTTDNNNNNNIEDDINDVEASAIRGMIQKAVGLAFIRSNKVVFGVSLSGGSGIVLARLNDGTWSAPSLISMAGMGFGIQIGLEVANYIFILQSKEALEHFQHGGSFTLGGNVGLAFAGMGREAIGAASVSSALCGITSPPIPIKEDEYNYDIDEEELLFDNIESYEVDTKTGQRIPIKNTNTNTCSSSRRRRKGGGGRKNSNAASCGGRVARCSGGGRSSRGEGTTTSEQSQSQTSLTISSLLLNENIAGVAPIVAYAKSEGLYVGVSLEGSRIYTRNDMNEKVYKYSSYNHKIVSARDILTGKIISRPKEAEYLYSLLHKIELTYDISCLPSIPKSKLLFNGGNGGGDWTRSWDSSSPPYNNHLGINSDDDDDGITPTPTDNNKNSNKNANDNDDGGTHDDIDEYYNKFQDFLFGGITVLRISPQTNQREQRTLWLQSTPSRGEQGSVRIGFVSKLYSATAQSKHLSASIIQDVSPPANNNSNSNNNHLHHNNFNKNGGNGGASIISEMDGDDLTLDSALLDNQSLLTTTGTLQERVELSKKLSMDLVDVLSLTTQNAPPEIRLLDNDGQQESSGRIICIESLDTQLVFVGRTIEETRLLFCGLKILLEKETARIGIRGGQGIKSATGSKKKKGGGILSALKGKNNKILPSSLSSKQYYSRKNGSGYASSDIDDTEDNQPYDPSEYYHEYGSPGSSSSQPRPQSLPEGWKSWGRVPGRSYMRAQSASTDDGYPTYAHGQLLIRDVCKNVLLPLPLPLCRVLLLDSSSPVISKWENDRGDTDFERTPWTFPPATPREMEQFQSEHQLIASGSMCGAHRTISYERYRNGQPIRLSETHIVDSDDSEKLAFQVNERLPRRGFSIKVKLLLRGVDNGNACEATVLGEIRPVGKNMSDPAAVHKALLKVMDELRNRYGTDCVGLLAGFMSVVENMPKDESTGSSPSSSSSSQWRTGWEEKKESEHYRTSSKKKPLDKTSVVKFEDVMNADLGAAEDVQDYSKFAQERRPSNSTSAKDYKSRSKSKARSAPVDDTFNTSSSDPVTIEVKPLPKIRLSLMPSPREEDEEDLDDDGDMKSMKEKSTSSKSKSSKSKRSSWGKKKKSSSDQGKKSSSSSSSAKKR